MYLIKFLPWYTRMYVRVLIELSQCSGRLRLETALHSRSSGLLIHHSGYSYVCLGLKVCV